MFTEEDWSSEDGGTPYEKSKARAERAAWELVKNLPGSSVFLPVCTLHFYPFHIKLILVLLLYLLLRKQKTGI